MPEIVLIEIAGPDRPGLTKTLTEVLARYQVTVLDIGQSVIHSTLALGMLIEVPDDSGACPVFKELLFTAHGLGLTLRLTPVTLDDYEGWVQAQGLRGISSPCSGPRSAPGISPRWRAWSARTD